MISELISQALTRAKSPPRLTVSEWADQYRYLSPEASAEPGKWRNDRAPHTVAPMDALSPYDPCQEVVCMFSSQTAKTEILLNFAGYIMDVDPGPVLVIQPNVKPMGEAFSKDRIAPMLRDTPVLAEKFGGKSKARNSKDSTIMHKTFPGGHLTIGGANSPAGLASRPIRYVLFDEVDRFETTKEGDAIALGEKRTRTFHNRKIVKVSSPTYDDVGIHAAYHNCEQQFELHIGCPDCGEYQFPRLEHFEWDDDYREAVYICRNCGTAHPLEMEDRIKSDCKWVQIKDDGLRSKGFWANQWGSPFAPWVETIEEFLKAKKDSAKLQTVINTAFAETWKEHEQEIDPDALISFAENYTSADALDDVLVVTGGVDVQKDRLELQVVGWGYDGVPWIIDHLVFFGDTERESDKCWKDLDDALMQKYCGLRVTRCYIDSGYNTEQVYKFTKRRHKRQIFPSKGEAGEKDMVAKPRQSGPQRVMLVKVGIDKIKRILLSILNSPGERIHFSSALDEEWYKQLTAEKMIMRKEGGKIKKLEFKPIRERNEALDCFVYAFAAMISLNVNWESLKNKKQVVDEPEIEEEASNPKKLQRFAGKRRGGFVKNW